MNIRPQPVSRTVAPAVLAFVVLAASGAAQITTGAPFPRPAGSHEVAVERSVMVPMRDGVRLATDIYRDRKSVV